MLYILAVKNSRRHFTRQIIFSKSLLFSTLPPKVQTSPRNTRIFTPEREIKESRQPISFLKEFRSESVRFESAPYKIPSGQLRSPSEIRNDPPSKNPPHFITSRRPPLSPLQPSLQKEEKKEEGLEIFHRPPPIITSSTEGRRVSFNGGRVKNRELQKFPRTFPLGDACTRRVYPIFTQLPGRAGHGRIIVL